jgi:hypothetical protein
LLKRLGAKLAREPIMFVQRIADIVISISGIPERGNAAFAFIYSPGA